MRCAAGATAPSSKIRRWSAGAPPVHRHVHEHSTVSAQPPDRYRGATGCARARPTTTSRLQPRPKAGVRCAAGATAPSSKIRRWSAGAPPAHRRITDLSHPARIRIRCRVATRCARLRPRTTSRLQPPPSETLPSPRRGEGRPAAGVRCAFWRDVRNLTTSTRVPQPPTTSPTTTSIIAPCPTLRAPSCPSWFPSFLSKFFVPLRVLRG